MPGTNEIGTHEKFVTSQNIPKKGKMLHTGHNQICCCVRIVEPYISANPVEIEEAPLLSFLSDHSAL